MSRAVIVSKLSDCARALLGLSFVAPSSPRRFGPFRRLSRVHSRGWMVTESLTDTVILLGNWQLATGSCCQFATLIQYTCKMHETP